MALNKFSNEVQAAVNPSLAQEDYGPVGRFMLVIVAVEEDVIENLKFCDKHNKAGIYTHPFTKEKVGYYSLAVPLNPKEILSLSENDLRKSLISEMIKIIGNPVVKIPKGFEYEKLTQKLTLDFEILGRATFE